MIEVEMMRTTCEHPVTREWHGYRNCTTCGAVLLPEAVVSARLAVATESLRAAGARAAGW